MKLRLENLEPSRDAEKIIQSVLEGAPHYYHLIQGATAGPADATSSFMILPPGWSTYENKFVMAIYNGDIAIGCVDLIRGYPDLPTAFLGLLLISEKFQGQGLGLKSYKLVEELASRWNGIKKIRIAVVSTNERVIPFWKKTGFKETGERKPYKSGTVKAEYVLMEKTL